jgi:hypothetical protein
MVRDRVRADRRGAGLCNQGDAMSEAWAIAGLAAILFIGVLTANGLKEEIRYAIKMWREKK